jgi:hypothetical protein
MADPLLDSGRLPRMSCESPGFLTLAVALLCSTPGSR